MSYTASDLLGVSFGFLLFAIFAFAPGYTFAALTNVFEFRRRRLITRLTAAIPLSIALTPIATYLLWHLSLPLVWIVFGASGAICLVLLIRDGRSLKLNLSRPGWMVLAISAGWLIVGACSLVDLQLGNRLYEPVSSIDLSIHTAFVAALARDGVPPHNPLFFAGMPAPLRYHYFWFIPSALVDRLGGGLVSARLGAIDGILWAGLGLIAILALYLRLFRENGGRRIERRTLIAVLMLAITGLDILPVAIIDLSTNILLPNIEMWNNQISAWVTTALWSPHDLASLIAGLTGFLLTWDVRRQEQRRQRIAGLAGGGLAFASAAGASVYVGGTLAACCLIWLAIGLLKRWRRHVLILTGAGVLAALLLTPFMFQVTHGPAGPNASNHFPFSLTVRSFTFATALAGRGNLAKLQALNAVLLPLNYFLEFGFFFVVGWVMVQRFWRRGLGEQAEWAAVTLSLSSLLVITFVRSTTIENNDLGWRGALIVQFFLLLWAAELWDEGILGFGRPRSMQPGAHRAVAPRLVAATLVLGALGSCYELFMQRSYPIVSDWCSVPRYSWLSPDHQLGRRTFAVRRAYEQLNRVFPANDVIQADPNPDLGNFPAEMYSGRQMVADGGACGTTFGGSLDYCRDVILPQLKPLFDDGVRTTRAEAEQTCRGFSISALFFKDTDPVWKDESAWMWKTKPLLSNSFVRVIPCGTPSAKQVITQAENLPQDRKSALTGIGNKSEIGAERQR